MALRWDCKVRLLARQCSWWWWNHIKRADGRVDRRAAAEELALRRRRAVERRWNAGGESGLPLDGWLDSRAILAAVPSSERSPITVANGLPDSLDACVARRGATIRSADAHFVEISARDWLQPRSDGVWWTEGNTNILDLHGIEARPAFEKPMDVNLDGYRGDNFLRGDRLQASQVHERPRRGIHRGLRALRGVAARRSRPARPPGCSEHWLLEVSARRWIAAPCCSRSPTGRAASRFLRTTSSSRGSTAGVTAAGIPGRGPRGSTDYPKWLRGAPARAFVDDLLPSPSSLYREHEGSERAVAVWEAHLAGADHASEIGRYLTVEPRLRQFPAGTNRLRLSASGVFARAWRRPARRSAAAGGR